MRFCDWKDSKKQSKLAPPITGSKCYVLADKKITHRVGGRDFVSYRCVWHVPPEESKLGTVTVEDYHQEKKPLPSILKQANAYGSVRTNDRTEQEPGIRGF